MNPTEIADLLGHSATSVTEHYAASTSVRPRETVAHERLVATLIDSETRARADRLACCREYLAATVDQVSPLLLDLYQHDQIDLDAIARRMSATDPWPSGLSRRSWLSVLRRARERDAQQTGGFARLVTGNLLAVVQPPLVVRQRGDSRGALAVRALNGCLKVTAELGTAMLQTRVGLAKLTISTPIPHTLRLALRGMPLDAVVDHPSLADCGYMVDSTDRRPTGQNSNWVPSRA